MIDFLGASSKGYFQASHFSETAGKTLLASTDSVAGRDAVDVEAQGLAVLDERVMGARGHNRYLGQF